MDDTECSIKAGKALRLAETPVDHAAILQVESDVHRTNAPTFSIDVNQNLISPVTHLKSHTETHKSKIEITVFTASRTSEKVAIKPNRTVTPS